jgi:type I restriction enzyme M protein
MLDQETKRRIDTARDILVGKLPNPQSQVEQITIAMIYKFMDDMDKEAMEFGGEAAFFTGDYEKYSWTKIFDPKLGGYEMLALYGEAIVKLNQNPNLPQLFRDIFKNAYLPYRDPETLKLFLKVINEFRYDHSEKLGDAFEYLLSVLGSQGDAGQFRTPRHIIDFMVAIMQPKKDESICDPACGTAGFLISSYKHILNENTKKNKGDLLTPDERKKLINNITGYDISSEMVRLSLVNMYLHGFTTPKIYEYDTLTSTERWGDTFDIIMANPPFMTPKGGIRPHKKFEMKANRSEVLFVDYIMEHINPTTGRAAVIVPEGIIFQSANAYKTLRKSLVEKNFLYGVVSLPAGIFQPYSGVKTSILLLDKTLAKKTDKILFVKIENDGYSLGAQRKELATSDLPDAANFIKQYISAIRNDDFPQIDFENLPLNFLVIEKSRIAENGDYNLSGDRYKDSIVKKHSKFDLVELSEVCDLYQPQTISASDFKENGDYKVFGANGVIGYYDKYNHEDSEVLITCRGATCGTINFSEPKSWITGNAMVAKPIDNRINKRFLFHLLKVSDLSSVITGAAQPQITRASLSPFKIPLPPITVQSEIETKIEQYEKIIAGARQVVENYKPHIDIKPEWEMVELGSVCEINPKKSELKDLNENIDVSFVPMADINENEMDFIPKQVKKLADVYSGYTYFKNDDVLLAKVTPCFENGKAGIAKGLINGIGFGSSEYFVIRPNDKILSVWIYLNVIQESFKEKGKLNMTGTGGLQRVSPEFIKNTIIPLPHIEIQKQIVSQIEKEQQLVDANKELIKIYEQKIKDEINKLWSE